MRGGLAACLAAGLLGGALVVLASGRPWGAAPETPPGTGLLPGAQADADGSLAASLGAVVLLGAVVVAVTRSLGRRLAGALVALAGIGSVAVAASAGAPWWPWRLVVLLGGLLGLAAGALATARGHRWAAMSRRYDAPTAPTAPPGPHETDAWRALDRGDDPTLW